MRSQSFRATNVNFRERDPRTTVEYRYVNFKHGRVAHVMLNYVRPGRRQDAPKNAQD